MKLQFISDQHVTEAVKFLAGQGHLPFTDASGKPNHRLMGAAWAALHGGYRGNKYTGKNKGKALAKLKAVYKSEKMDTPAESYALDGEFFQEALAQSDSFDSIRCQVMDAINANIKAGIDMDGDDDGAEDSGQCTNCGCVCGQEYGCQCCAQCECTYPESAWCRDLFPGAVVYSMEGKLMQADYTVDADGDVQLGTPFEVETSYTPVDTVESDEPSEAEDSDDAEQYLRLPLVSAMPFEESGYDASSGKLTMTVIKPGLNKSKARFYPAETLKRDYKVFENAKMFADHQSEKESKERPEGSVNNWVAQINKVWPESDGTIKATATVIDPPFKAKLDALAKEGMLHEMGVSIRAIGEASEGEREGVTTNVVESLIAARSVDFVTYAGAGGQIETMESATEKDDNDIDLVTEAGLRKRRPDLIRIVEKHFHEETEKKMKSVEQQLQESQTQLAALTKENGELKTKITASEKTAAKATVQAELSKQLAESKLPEILQARIRKQFAETDKIEGIEKAVGEAITEEQEIVKKLGGGTKTASGPKNLGAAANGTTKEAEEKTKPNLEEAFALLPGMSKDDAKRAASL